MARRLTLDQLIEVRILAGQPDLQKMEISGHMPVLRIDIKNRSEMGGFFILRKQLNIYHTKNTNGVGVLGPQPPSVFRIRTRHLPLSPPVSEDVFPSPPFTAGRAAAGGISPASSLQRSGWMIVTIS
jgi:hypothetical protein